MASNETLTRRTALKLGVAAGATTVLAGCTGSDGDGSVSIDPGTRIVFGGYSTHWEGSQPADIEGMENPTLVLEEGETYEMGWDDGDGVSHNIEIHDDDGNVVDDLSTEQVASPDDDQFLEFEATSEMAEYVCAPHPMDMLGQIEVE